MPSPAPAPVSDFARFLVPVVLVTSERGREVYASSYQLFDRLEAIAKHKDVMPWRGDEVVKQITPTEIMAVWHGDETLSPESLRTFNYFLRSGGLALFQRSLKGRKGPERARHTKWAWRYLVEEYLDLRWEARR